MRNAIADEIYSYAKANSDFMLIAGDAGLGVWDEYAKNLKQQFINPGINEALCVSMAAGMSLAGARCCYYNIAPFVIMRPFEQVRNDICYQELPVILVGTGAGITYAPAGMTHYAVEDIALALSLPNLDIYSPSCGAEARACFKNALLRQKPSYIRIEKSGEAELNAGEVDINGLNFIKRDSDKVLIISHGSIASECLEIEGISLATLPFINSQNEAILNELQSFKYVFVLEEHYKFGGLGSLIKSKTDKKIYQIALPNRFIHEIGGRGYLRKLYGIDRESIKQKVEQICKG